MISVDDPALTHIKKLLAAGQSPEKVKADLVLAGWDAQVVDLFLEKVKHPGVVAHKRGVPKIVWLLLVVILIAAVGGGYVYWQRTRGPVTQPVVAPVPEFTASPSAFVVPPDPEKLKIGLGLLFMPPEFSYVATLSAKISDCTSSQNYTSHIATDSSYYKTDTQTNSSGGCVTAGLGNRFDETYLLTTDKLVRTLPIAKFKRLSKNPGLAIPATPDTLIKSLVPKLENVSILESTKTDEGTVLRTEVKSDILTGIYTFTIRPVGYQIIRMRLDSTLTQNGQSLGYVGEIMFRNRAMVIPPLAAEIE